MGKWRGALNWPTSLADIKLAQGCSAFIIICTASYLFLGFLALMVWRITGNDSWIENFFRTPGAVVIVLLAASEVLMSFRVMGEFSAGHGMHKAWRLIAISGACNLAGALLAQILSVETPLNPFLHESWWDASTADMLRAAGLALGGPFRFALLTAGLFWVLRMYRRSGFLARLAAVDWIALAFIGLYVALEARDLTVALQKGKHPTPAEVFGWPVDPLLWLLLAQGLLLFRSVQQMGQGWISRCWRAFSIGIFLVALGDISIWATNWGYLQWPWIALQWYLWIPAAGAFALAPTYQWEAISQARSSARQVI